jgi:hypothetical protein
MMQSMVEAAARVWGNVRGAHGTGILGLCIPGGGESLGCGYYRGAKGGTNYIVFGRGAIAKRENRALYHERH